jgi:hypothetical protein
LVYSQRSPRTFMQGPSHQPMVGQLISWRRVIAQGSFFENEFPAAIRLSLDDCILAFMFSFVGSPSLHRHLFE